MGNVLAVVLGNRPQLVKYHPSIGGHGQHYDDNGDKTANEQIVSILAEQGITDG